VKSPPAPLAEPRDVWHPAGMRRFLLVALLAGCPSPSHPVPVYESDEGSSSPTTSSASTESSTPPEAPPPAPTSVARPFFYEIRTASPDVPPSYALATLGRGARLDEALPTRLHDRLHAARVVVVPTDLGGDVLVRDAQRVGLLRRGTGSDFYPPLVWQSLTHELREQVSLDQLRATRPFLHFAPLAVHRARTLLPEAPNSMDTELFAYARERGLTLRPLGSPLDELRMLGAASDREVAALVTLWVQRPEVLERDLRGMREAYLSGDEARMLQEFADPDERAVAPSFYRSVERRPSTWIRPIRRELDEGNAFLALPFRALLSPDGIFEKLRAAGYTITRVD
jgi:uncharacterized protein YbaP (TraB family)